MLYPTHKKYGEVYGLASIPLAVALGVVPTVSLGDPAGKIVVDFVISMIYVWVCYSGALFGAEFPDIDSPGSIPARKHPIIQKLFALFKVKHRGKFSHDFISLGLLFGGIYVIVDGMLGSFMQFLLSQGVGNSELTPLIALFSDGGLLLNLLKTYIIFTLIGAYSHLIADASTKQGVWLFWSIRIHIVPVFITRWTFNGRRPFERVFNTGTGWEMLNRNAMTYVFLPLAIIFCLASIIHV